MKAHAPQTVTRWAKHNKRNGVGARQHYNGAVVVMVRSNADARAHGCHAGGAPSTATHELKDEDSEVVIDNVFDTICISPVCGRGTSKDHSLDMASCNRPHCCMCSISPSCAALHE